LRTDINRPIQMASRNAQKCGAGRRCLGWGEVRDALCFTMPDSENWKLLLSVYAKHPDTALNLAEQFHILKEFLQQGTKGIPKVIAELDEAIKALHPHTEFYKLGEKMYQQRIAGKLKPKHEHKLRDLGVKF